MFALWLAIVEHLETEEQIRTAEQIFLTYRNAMFQIAYEILDNANDAEDVVGDTIVKICRNIDCFVDKPTIEQKLLVKKYTERTAIDLWRKKSRTVTESFDDAIFSDSDNEKNGIGEEDDIVFLGEEFGTMQKYVEKLPQKYRDLLVLKYVEEYKNKEIANLFHISENAVDVQLSRVKKRLAQMILEGEKNG